MPQLKRKIQYKIPTKIVIQAELYRIDRNKKRFSYGTINIPKYSTDSYYDIKSVLQHYESIIENLQSEGMKVEVKIRTICPQTHEYKEINTDKTTKKTITEYEKKLTNKIMDIKGIMNQENAYNEYGDSIQGTEKIHYLLRKIEDNNEILEFLAKKLNE